MRADGQPNSSARGRVSKSKVKSGCRTCKIRKVKCDEGRPACHRCSSTGRVCDGYGIWGGGNVHAHRQSLYSQLLEGKDRALSLQGYVCVISASTEEATFFDWFKCRTAPKLAGAFALTFWNTLLFQASVTEPAVMHAVLTLSSVHKRIVSSCATPRRRDDILDEQEQFILHSYNKAIAYLRPHMSIKNRSSVRIALIACVVFTCLEFLRGHFRTAQNHLQHGLKVLGAIHGDSCDGNNLVCASKQAREPVDDWINEAFSRLQVQVVLLEQKPQFPYLVQPSGELQLSTSRFHSVNHAWQCLERLFHTIVRLCEHSREKGRSERLSRGQHAALQQQQQQIQDTLRRWREVVSASEASLQTHMRGVAGIHLLHYYYNMATIMAATCLRPDDETLYDDYTEQFVQIIKVAVRLWAHKQHDLLEPFPPGDHPDMSNCMVDMGWIPPLYYTALKCRVHEVRLQAVQLLECTSHREGIWDATIAACVARKVKEIEERDFYARVESIANVRTIDDWLKGIDLSLPALPDACRIHDVELVLSNGSSDSVFMFYKQKQPNGEVKACGLEYRVASRSWVPA